MSLQNAEEFAFPGANGPHGRRRVLRTGPLRLEIVDGQPGALKISGERALDAVRFVVRDRYWRSVPLRLSCVERKGNDRAEFRLDSAAFGFDFEVRMSIEVRPANAIAIHSWLEARSDLLTNRAGLVLLHPARLAGVPVAVYSRDGSCQTTNFPEIPRDACIFRNVAGLRYGVTRRWAISVDLDGDDFETEDQRLWSDPSFKTYSRSIDQPIPYTVAAGSSFEQTVVITARETMPSARTVSAQSHQSDGRKVPSIGLSIPPGTWCARAERWDRIAEMEPEHFLLEFDGRHPRPQIPEGTAGIPVAWLFSCREANPSALVGDTGYCSPFAVLVEDAEKSDINFLRENLPQAMVGAGTRTFLPSLLALKPDWDPDCIAWSVSPCVHDTDDDVVTGSLAVVPRMVEAGRRAFKGADVWLGPVTMRPRFRPLERGKDVPTLSTESDSENADTRQWELFGAAWTTGFAAAAALAGVSRISFFEPFGERGLVEPAGRVSPAYHILKRLMRHRKRRLAQNLSRIRPNHALLAVEVDDGVRLWLANLGAKALLVSGLAQACSLAVLDDEGWVPTDIDEAYRLGAFAVAEIGFSDEHKARHIRVRHASFKRGSTRQDR